MNTSSSGRRTILMAGVQPYWWCLQTGTQHLARQFGKDGFDVHYLSAPITPLHLAMLGNGAVRRRFANAFGHPWPDPLHGVRSYVPFALLAPDAVPVLGDRLVTDHWHRTLIPGIRTWLRRHALERVDILYVDNLSYHFLFDYVACGKSIFRVADLHGEFPGWGGRTGRMATKIAARADLTIYSARGLEPYVASLAPRRAVFVPNGVDFSHFQAPPKHGRPPSLGDIPDPIVLYSGILDARLDVALLRRAAEALPEVSFVLAGPPGAGARMPGLPGNVHSLGPVPHEDVPDLMRAARAGMIPFDVRRHMALIQGVRPLKLLEYMAAGLPVISARWPELEDMNSPARLYDDEAGFVRLVEETVRVTHDPTASVEFARGHDWSGAYALLRDALAGG